MGEWLEITCLPTSHANKLIRSCTCVAQFATAREERMDGKSIILFALWGQRLDVHTVGSKPMAVFGYYGVWLREFFVHVFREENLVCIEY